MPEGHVLHRLAGDLNRHFAGREVRVSSPQGRFADEAAIVDRRELIGAEAYGKHLFIAFDADAWIHVHLGLIGTLTLTEPGPVRGVVRLRIATDERVADLRGPQTCALVDSARVARVRAELGPDPLRPDADPDAAWRRIHASARPVSALLLEQSVLAGPGNIYRAEVLFRAGVDPMLPGNRLPRTVWNRIWNDLVALMAEGVRTGRIDTVAAEHTPEAMGRDPRVDDHGGEVYVYRRTGQPCLVCGAPVRATAVAGRQVYWCPRCQRSGRTGVRRARGGEA
ncbi:Fpg/Nei family DNA glycosylase [Enemella sp. A6]|uniref:Fpg/Nei family DNA glycosylase n=1 Tax=Enemella sp. A6 TaxID=3440152 RepID=UPI003EBAFF44